MGGGVDGGGLDRLQRRQPGAHQQGELTRIVAMRRHAAVGAEGDADPARMGATRHIQHLRPRLQGLGRLGRREEIPGAGGDARDEIARHQGRHQICPLAPEQTDRFVVQIGPVLDRIAPGAQEGVDAVDAVGVGGHTAAHAMAGADDGRQLVLRELLAQTRGRVRQHATGRSDLDDVRPGPNLGPDGAHTILDARTDTFGRQNVQNIVAITVGVAMAAVNRNARSRGDDTGSRHVAAPDGLPQGEDRLIGPAQVRHGGEARHQGAPGVARADEGAIRGRQRHGLQPGVGVLFAGQMHMAVDQSREHEGVPQIDDPTLSDEAVADFDDFVPLDHESFIAQNNTGRRVRQQAPRLDEHGFA